MDSPTTPRLSAILKLLENYKREIEGRKKAKIEINIAGDRITLSTTFFDEDVVK